MRLLYCAGSTIPSDSANSIHVMRMCDALSSLGHQVTLLCKAGEKTTTEAIHRFYGTSGNFEIERVPFRNRRDLLRYVRIAKTIPHDSLIGRYLPAIWLLRNNGKRLLFESHARPAGFRRLLEWSLLRARALKGHIVISERLRQLYLETFNDSMLGKTRVLHDAAADPGAPTPLRTSGTLIVGYAGSWFEGRGIELMLTVARQCPGIEFRLAGESEGRPGELPDNVTSTGRLPHAEVESFLRDCDVLLAPYQHVVRVSGNAGNSAEWCSPLKLFEYMAAGKAILCSALPVMSEVLTDGQNALLLPPEDDADWARAIRELDADRARGQRLGDTARKDFRNTHTWVERARRYLEPLE